MLKMWICWTLANYTISAILMRQFFALGNNLIDIHHEVQMKSLIIENLHGLWTYLIQLHFYNYYNTQSLSIKIHQFQEKSPREAKTSQHESVLINSVNQKNIMADWKLKLSDQEIPRLTLKFYLIIRLTLDPYKIWNIKILYTHA